MFDTIDYSRIKEIAKERGCRTKDLIVLSPDNDPFYVGTPANWRWGEWFTVLWQRFGYQGGVHLRRVHYQVISQKVPVLMPDGQPYENSNHCWGKLTAASKQARYLNLIDVGHFSDRRNAEAQNYGSAHYEYEPYIELTQEAEEDNLQLPEFPDLPSLFLYDYRSQQRYHIEIWCEKSTMNDVLEPLCQKFGATLQVGVGEMSITRTYDLVNRLERFGKPTRIFYVSDFDPAGKSMPVAVSRKLEYFIRTEERELDVRLYPVVLTQQQVKSYNLPRTPIKATERRKDRFEQRFGAGATELDALEALYPGELERLLRQEFERYHDPQLTWRIDQKQREILGELADAEEETQQEYKLELGELRSEYEKLIAEFEDRFESHNDKRRKLWQVIRNDLDFERRGFDLEERYPVPSARYADERDGALLDTELDYFEQLEVYKDFQGKEVG